ncbi:rRNA-processing protein utp23 [Termitomyces sp. J132]|nr:rRNA-processing protein utp23 [Termitomyces sp. J132]
MRQKRAKAYRKLMSLYSMTFGFRQPYQVLVDSEILKTATEQKIELVHQLGIILQGEVKPMITQCCIHELYLQGKSQQPTVDLAKTFERRKCNHREPIPGDDCLVSVVGPSNKHRYVISTQSQPLRVRLRKIPAVPIVHINRSVMVLEPPSDLTLETKAAVRQKALQPSPSELTFIGPSTSAETPKKKKRGPKGPNPLSVKKKKKLPVESPSSTKGKTKSVIAHISTSVSTDKKRKRNEHDDQPHSSSIVDNTMQQKKRQRKVDEDNS